MLRANFPLPERVNSVVGVTACHVGNRRHFGPDPFQPVAANSTGSKIEGSSFSGSFGDIALSLENLGCNPRLVRHQIKGIPMMVGHSL